ncbi:MAG: CapA family protein, partial [Lachnospiraceae bacterium]|nr:CapA family protein [Lachnospiraceae bacterium]
VVYMRQVMMALASAVTILFLLWNSGTFLPRWVRWENSAGYDASGKYKLLLSKKSVSVTYEDSVIWTSPDGVKVQKALFCDADNDGQEELVLLCWKKGRYGKVKPIWVEQDERNWSQHIFVYEYTKGEVKPKWMSSYIGQDVADIASNQKSAPYSRLWLTDLEDEVSSWVWDSWGFAKEDTDISFVAFGDLLVHEPIYRYGLNNGGDFGFLFENVKAVLAESDIAVINQETPLTDNPSMYSDYPRFGTPVQVGEAVADAGFDVVTCATNHALDRGTEGVSFTKTFFDDCHVTCLGIQSQEEKEYQAYQIITRNGVRFALLNYTYGTNGLPIPDKNPNIVHLLDD